MKYIDFGPSQLETQLIDALSSTSDSWIQGLGSVRIVKKTPIKDRDRPELVLTLEDEDGDQHEVTLRVIHTPEEDLIAQGYLKNEPADVS